MSTLSRKLEQLAFYGSLVNPLAPKRDRVCRSFSRGAHRSFERLSESELWSRERLQEQQDEKLRTLIRHAYRNVPYYRGVFDRLGLSPDDIANVEDLRKLPILTKDIIRRHFPEGITCGDAGDDGLWTTGGSTSEPLKFFSDPRANDLAWAAFFRFYRWHGYEWGDRVAVFFRPAAIKDARPFWQKGLGVLKDRLVPNVKYYDASSLQDADLARVADDLVRSQVDVLRGYASALERLARYCREHRIRIRPKFIASLGETLFPWQRELLEGQFGCKVFDQYGCSEIMSVGFECERREGLHLTPEHCVVEVVDKKGERLPAGVPGALLLTDLDNHRMPFIRYAVGDEGLLKPEPCACGRPLPLMGQLIGREFDMIIGPNGRVAHGLFFATLFQDAGWFERFGVTDFEIVQSAKDRLEVALVVKSAPSQVDQDAFANLCRREFGEMDVRLRFADSIPRSRSGKRRYTRNDAP